MNTKANHNKRYVPSKTELKFGQLNLQNSCRASSEARHIMCERNIDFFSIQEPYSIGGIIKGFGLSTTNVVLGNKEPDDRPMSAIVCTSNKNPFLMLQHCNNHFTVCKISTAIGFINLVSGYSQCAQQIEPYLDTLQSIIDDVRGEELLISIDANAHSHDWYSKEEGEKGVQMADFINNNNLIILNRNFQPPTHKSGTNIDLTLSTITLSNHVESWEVLPDVSISDHNLIRVTVDVGRECQSKILNKYKTKNANYEVLNQSLSEKVLALQNLNSNTPEEAELLVKAYQNSLTRTCEDHLAKIKISDKYTPWWNTELTRTRKEMKKKSPKLLSMQSETGLSRPVSKKEARVQA